MTHQTETMSFLLHNFPDAIFRRLLAKSSNVFHKDVFFDGPSGEEKWILCKSTILDCHIPASKIKRWRVWQYKNDDTVYSCSITAPENVMSNRLQHGGWHLNQYDGIGWFLRPSHDTGKKDVAAFWTSHSSRWVVYAVRSKVFSSMIGPCSH